MSNSLQQGCDSVPSDYFDFIIGPLEELLQDQTRQLTDILEQLAILAVRFQRSYVEAFDIDWTQEFQTEVIFFERLCHMSSLQLAHLLTKSDIETFRSLRPQDILDHNEGVSNGPVRKVGMRWNRLCEAVQECVTTNYELGHSVDRLAEVNTFHPSPVQLLIMTTATIFCKELQLTRCCNMRSKSGFLLRTSSTVVVQIR